MTGKVIWALVIIGIVALILIFTRGDVTVNLLLLKVRAATALVLLVFVGIGVTIGVLLK